MSVQQQSDQPFQFSPPLRLLDLHPISRAAKPLSDRNHDSSSEGTYALSSKFSQSASEYLRGVHVAARDARAQIHTVSDWKCKTE